MQHFAAQTPPKPQQERSSARASADGQSSSSSPLIHAAAISTVLLTSVALVPYLLVRSRLTSLHQQVAQLGSANEALRRDVKMLVGENAIRRNEQQRFVRLLEETRAGVDGLGSQWEGDEEVRREESKKIREGLRDLKQTIERVEMDAVKREQAGAEWRRNLADKFSWLKK
ncbi:uncharacterized protein LAESUDRAFT_760089 [Laetiporus sulphureus 93-53]|uniref:Endoplasmic reticulum transmembrane protein n=1 Tax=Laetiporus sulphureus 93-53 TaxID=1314785 RepID=A0A165DSE7_9APHY|nr:uncharacterized protein LAESUDRAFT_760089 [Laetiporus sulphureus 93-53]KZT05533.1 hypothetical protein LAESUDRAFT_760089 [Laetiporus sulphureus 93-53]